MKKHSEKDTTEQSKKAQEAVKEYPQHVRLPGRGFIKVSDVKGMWDDNWVSNDFCFTFISEFLSNWVLVDGFVPEKLHKQTLQLRINEHCHTELLSKEDFTLKISVDLQPILRSVFS
jgi:hypothetical protein